MVIAVLLESSLIHILSIKGVWPNLTLILVLFVALNSDWQETIEASIIGGLLRGVFTIGPVGISLVVLSFCGIFAAYCKNKVYKNSFLTQITLTLLIACIYNILTLFVARLGKDAELATIGLDRPFASIVFMVSLYTAFAAPFVFFFLKRSLKARVSEF
jgi:rod shape-determining protein MreD